VFWGDLLIYFFNLGIVVLIVLETSGYVEQCIRSVILKHSSRDRHRVPVSSEEMCDMLKGIIQKPAYK
jgi:hypothetical protein